MNFGYFAMELVFFFQTVCIHIECIESINWMYCEMSTLLQSVYHTWFEFGQWMWRCSRSNQTFQNVECVRCALQWTLYPYVLDVFRFVGVFGEVRVRVKERERKYITSVHTHTLSHRVRYTQRDIRCKQWWMNRNGNNNGHAYIEKLRLNACVMRNSISEQLTHEFLVYFEVELENRYDFAFCFIEFHTMLH